jgi:hypothetical protein
MGKRNPPADPADRMSAGAPEASPGGCLPGSPRLPAPRRRRASACLNPPRWRRARARGAWLDRPCGSAPNADPPARLLPSSRREPEGDDGPREGARRRGTCAHTDRPRPCWDFRSGYSRCPPQVIPWERGSNSGRQSLGKRWLAPRGWQLRAGGSCECGVCSSARRVLTRACFDGGAGRRPPQARMVPRRRHAPQQRPAPGWPSPLDVGGEGHAVRQRQRVQLHAHPGEPRRSLCSGWSGCSAVRLGTDDLIPAQFASRACADGGHDPYSIRCIRDGCVHHDLEQRCVEQEGGARGNRR